MNNSNKKWTDREDKILLRQVKALPQNLAKCFIIVAEQTGRTKGAVSNRWYTVLSKKPEALCFFTASSKHVSRNRKNGMGETSNKSIWKKFMAILRNL